MYFYYYYLYIFYIVDSINYNKLNYIYIYIILRILQVIMLYIKLESLRRYTGIFLIIET